MQPQSNGEFCILLYFGRAGGCITKTSPGSRLHTDDDKRESESNESAFRNWSGLKGPGVTSSREGGGGNILERFRRNRVCLIMTDSFSSKPRMLSQTLSGVSTGRGGRVGSLGTRELNEVLELSPSNLEIGRRLPRSRGGKSVIVVATGT